MIASPSFVTSSAISSRPSAVSRCRRRSEDGLGLFLGQADGAVLLHHMARIGDQRHQRRHVLRRPGARHQLLARRCGIGRGADQRDDVVDIGDGDRQADQDMAAVARLGEIDGACGG